MSNAFAPIPVGENGPVAAPAAGPAATPYPVGEGGDPNPGTSKDKRLKKNQPSEAFPAGSKAAPIGGKKSGSSSGGKSSGAAGGKKK